MIRKRCEDLHVAIDAAASDEEIAKLARVANQACSCSLAPPRKTRAESHGHHFVCLQCGCTGTLHLHLLVLEAMLPGHHFHGTSTASQHLHIVSKGFSNKIHCRVDIKGPLLQKLKHTSEWGSLWVQAQKVLVDIERKPHAKVRAYSSSEERDLLVKAAQAAKAAADLNGEVGIGSWIYKSLGFAR